MKRIIFILLILMMFFLFSCGENQYTISYNLNGGYLENETTSFKNGDDLELPMPTKENYIFGGWKENDKFIWKLENKNYNLDAFWIEKFDYEYIEDKDIFSQDELDYYVFIMRDGCSWCEKIQNDVKRYIYLTNEEQFNKVKKLYVINLYTNSVRSTIFRSYEENNGFYVDEAKSWDELYISSTPTLIEITEVDDVRSAKIIETGATAIKDTLNNSLYDDKDYSEKIKTYNITYVLDGGTYENPETSFNKWTRFDLRNPYKENYVFVGWYENDIQVTSFEDRDYVLTAKWKEYKETLYLNENEIYSLDDSYYIYFIKSTDDNSELINNINKYNTIAELYNKKYIYLVDLSKCETIYRQYSSADGYNIDNINCIEELYINQRKILIQISNHESTYLASGNKDLYSILENEVGIKITE